MSIQDAARPPVSAEKRTRFFIGIGLIVVSFLVYPAFVVILLLPLPAQIKVAAIVAASLASWAAFSAGIFLAGRRGYNWLKGRWKKLTDQGRKKFP